MNKHVCGYAANIVKIYFQRIITDVIEKRIVLFVALDNGQACGRVFTNKTALLRKFFEEIVNLL